MTPLFSVVTTVFDPEPEHLRACLASVEAQTHGSWEQILVDDGSRRAEIRAILDEAATDPRRTVIRRAVNGGIVAAGNDALGAASGEFVVLLDHDDVLTPDALATVAEALTDGVDVYYSDHDLLRTDGRCATPLFKPDFSLERLRNHNYITHLVVARRRTIEQVGGLRTGFDGAQDHDLLLRLAEVAAPFGHIPQILLHWRQSPASVASDPSSKPDAYVNGARAVAEHLARCGVPATVDQGQSLGTYRIHRAVVGRPKVSVIVPTRGSRGRVWGVERIFVHDAIASLVQAGGACDLEIVAVIDVGTDPLVERGLRRIVGDGLVVVPYEAPFNFAEKINLGVAASTGDFVLLLNDDTELIAPGSVDEMVGLAQDRSIGMVGAKLLFDDGRLQHGGHVYGGWASHALLGWPGDHPGPHNLLSVERECVGVTAAAALVRRDVFDAVGGMNEAFAVNYNDVDFSLRISRAGLRIVWTPHACWYHFEQRSGSHPISPHELALLDQLWADEVARDPYYNPNLASGRCDWLERPLLSGAPPYEVLDDGRVSWG